MIRKKLRNILAGFLIVFGILNALSAEDIDQSLVEQLDYQHRLDRKAKQEQECLVKTLWGEARGEPKQGIRAVLSVIHNRKQHKNYPGTYCEVVMQPKQFSYFNSNRNRHKKILAKDSERATLDFIEELSTEAAVGKFKPTVPRDVLYYAVHTVENHWTRQKQVFKRIGRHVLYKEGNS